MIRAVNRQEVFKESRMADLEIANRQNFYFQQLDAEDPELINALKPRYDHLAPILQKGIEANAFLILAYDTALSGSTYEKGFIDGLIKFYQYLNIHECFLIQDLNNHWQEFGFKSEQEKEKFFRLLGNTIEREGFRLDREGLKILLPLLFENNPDQGDFSIYTTYNAIQLGMLYWEGNFHISFFNKDRSSLEKAAIASSLRLYSRDEYLEYYYGNKIE